jgi:hypothetical protein
MKFLLIIPFVAILLNFNKVEAISFVKLMKAGRRGLLELFLKWSLVL